MPKSKKGKETRMVIRHLQGHHKVLAPACPKCQIALEGVRALQERKRALS